MKTQKNENITLNKKNFKKEFHVIKKDQKKPDGIFGSFMTRPVSPIAAYFFYRINFTPNMVTFLSFLFCLSSCLSLFLLKKTHSFFIMAAIIWWIGAILDAADGDLARYKKISSKFGAWFDSYLDRLKEFIIFGTLGFLAYKGYGISQWLDLFDIEIANEFYLFLGFFSILSNVMSGWISDTKKLFNAGERKAEIKFSEKYMFGMVDTRDFFIILSLCLFEVRIALYVYGLFFPFVLIMQIGLFAKRYGSKH